MNRFQYYQEMKGLARQVRAAHRLETPRVLRSDLRRIYREYQIRIDPWPYKLKHLRGAYFHDQIGTAVMIADHLPPEPRIFTLAHELKHHLVDRDLSLAYCSAAGSGAAAPCASARSARSGARRAGGSTRARLPARASGARRC